MRRNLTLPVIGALAILGTGWSVAGAQSPAPSASGPRSGSIVVTHQVPDQPTMAYVVPAAGGPLVDAPSVEARGAVPSPDGTRVALSVGTMDDLGVAVMDIDGTDLTPLEPAGSEGLSLFAMGWSPDGSRILAEGWSDAEPGRNGVYTLAADGTDLQQVTVAPEGSYDTPLAWSPDGAWIAHIVLPADTDRGALALVSLDGQTSVPLTSGTQTAWAGPFGAVGSWSPDGRWFAFSAFQDAVSELSATFLADTDGTVAQLSDWASFNTSSRISPDGSLILYDQGVGGGVHHLFTVRPDGSDTRQLTDASTRSGAGICCATWSPDGTAIAFQSGPDGGARLSTMLADGTDVRPVMDDPGHIKMLAWTR